MFEAFRAEVVSESNSIYIKKRKKFNFKMKIAKIWSQNEDSKKKTKMIFQTIY